MSRRIGIASLVWGSTILLSRVIGLVREAVVGRVLGGGDAADVFWMAFVIPDFLNYLLAGGALSIVFIPIFGGYLAKDDEPGGWAAFSAIANTLLVTMTLAVAALWVALPWLVPIYATGFDAEQSRELVALTRVVLPAQIFHVIGGLLSATLQARDRHVLPALAPLLYTGSIVLGGLIGGSTLGAWGFAWGVLVGSILGPFGLPFVGCLRWGFGWRPTLRVFTPDLRAYFLRSLPIMIGWSIVVVDDWILKQRASMMESGAISTLQYAKTLMKVPMGVFGLATGVASFPTITRLVAEGRKTEAYETLAGAVRRMLVLALGAQVVLTASGAEIAAVIYGERLGSAQHAAIGVALGILSIGLWAWASQTVVARGFYAMGNTWLPTLLGTGVVIIGYPLYAVLGNAGGTTGLSVASAVAISVYVVLLVIMLRRAFPGARDQFVSFALRMTPAVILGILAGLALEQVLDLRTAVGPFWGDLAQGSVLGAAGGGVYLGMALAVRVPEVTEVIGMVRRRLTRAR